jgi:3-oxoacyl-[acyl-carrier-protein] synthase II
MGERILKDKHGRPMVVVTGLGMLTALGEGCADNWAALTSGQSGIKPITRFPTEGLRTTIGGTIDFVKPDPFTCSSFTTEIARRAGREAIGNQVSVGQTWWTRHISRPPVHGHATG